VSCHEDVAVLHSVLIQIDNLRIRLVDGVLKRPLVAEDGRLPERVGFPSSQLPRFLFLDLALAVILPPILIDDIVAFMDIVHVRQQVVFGGGSLAADHLAVSGAVCLFPLSLRLQGAAPSVPDLAVRGYMSGVIVPRIGDLPAFRAHFLAVLRLEHHHRALPSRAVFGAIDVPVLSAWTVHLLVVQLEFVVVVEAEPLFVALWVRTRDIVPMAVLEHDVHFGVSRRV